MTFPYVSSSGKCPTPASTSRFHVPEANQHPTLMPSQVQLMPPDALVPQWLLLGHALPHGTHRTCKGTRCFRKTFPGKTGSPKTVKTLWKTPEEGRYSKSSFAFHPCTPVGARASAAPQGGRPTGRAAEKPGGQSCQNSSRRPSRQQEHFELLNIFAFICLDSIQINIL